MERLKAATVAILPQKKQNTSHRPVLIATGILRAIASGHLDFQRSEH
jgi:hypothetical protein